MQESQAIPNWVFAVLQNLALFSAGGLIVRLVTLWLNRKKPAVEIHKTAAEATEITIRSHATAGDSLTRMMDRLEQSVAQNDKLRSQLYNSEEKCNDLQEKCDKLEMEVESYDRQMKRMKGLLDVHSIKMTELDETK